MLVILVGALIILGPKRLPEAARQMGKAMAELRRVTSGFEAEVRDVLAEPAVTAEPSRPPSVIEPVEAPPVVATPATPADAELVLPADEPRQD